MKRILSLILSVSLVLVFASTSIAASNSTKNNAKVEELKFYHMYYYAESVWKPAKIMRDIYADFAKQVNVPGAKVKFTPVALTSDMSVPTLAAAKTAIGEFPDMIDLAGQPVPTAAIANGLVYNIKPSVDKDKMLKMNIGINYQQNMVNGKLYTVHEQLLTRGTWYNSTLTSDPGSMTDWNALAKAMATIRAKGKIAYETSSAILFIYADLAISQKGRDLMNKALTPSLLKSADFNVFKAAFMRTATELKVNGSENFKYNPDSFAKGDSAVFFNGVWAAGGYKPTDPALNNIKPGLYPGQVALIAAGGGLTVSNTMSQAKKDLAVKFIKYMTSDTVQKRIFLDVGANPCNPTINSNLIKLSAGKDKATVLLANACQMANNAKITVNSDTRWGSEVQNLIDTTVKNYIGDSSNPSIDSVYNKLVNDIIGLIE